VWLDPNKTSPFDFFQYWRNIGDGDVIKCLKMLTFLPLEQIDELSRLKDSEINRAKETLALELTALVHGAEEAARALDTSRTLFASGGAADMPETVLCASDFTDGAVDILTLLAESGLVPSKSEARRAVIQGGVEANGEKVSDIAKAYSIEQLSGEGIVVKRGKKSYRRVRLG
jgi:tyrosyl-tRNA synthetase